MNEDAPDKLAVAEQPAVEQQESNPLLETVQGFVADESEGYQEAIESRASEEARPGLMKRLVTSAKARMAMTIVAGASALTLGGAPQAEAGIKIKKVLQGVQDAARVAGPLLEHGGQVLAQEEALRAEQARVRAYEAQTAMRDATYKLRRIEAELPRIERQVKVAQFSALKYAANDVDAQEVRDIMMKRTGVKIELWKAAYAGNQEQVEELGKKDRELEESLLPHLRGRIAQRTGDLFVNTIMPGELKMLDLEGEQRYLQDAMGRAGQALHIALSRWQAHEERAQRAYNLAIIGAGLSRGY